MAKSFKILGFTIWEKPSPPIEPQPGDVVRMTASMHYPLLKETKTIRVNIPIGEKQHERE